MSTIREVYLEIRRIKKEQDDKNQNKYKHLVGRCFCFSQGCLEKVIKISSVTPIYGDDLVMYDCVRVVFDKRNDYNSSLYISMSTPSSIRGENIDRCEVSKRDFNEAFDSCIKSIKNEINK